MTTLCSFVRLASVATAALIATSAFAGSVALDMHGAGLAASVEQLGRGSAEIAMSGRDSELTYTQFGASPMSVDISGVDLRTHIIDGGCPAGRQHPETSIAGTGGPLVVLPRCY